MLASRRLPQDDLPPPDRLFAARVLREEARARGLRRASASRGRSEPPRLRPLHRLDRRRTARRDALPRGDPGRPPVPRTLLPGARSVVCLAAPYAGRAVDAADGSRIARYARGADYHGSLRGRALARGRGRPRPARRTRGAPGLRRLDAARGAVVRRGRGPRLDRQERLPHRPPSTARYLLLAEILTDLDLPADAPVAESCGSCVRCLERVPDRGLRRARAPRRRTVPRLLDHRAPRADPRRVEGGARPTHVFGCDVCQEVCPWNAPLRALPRSRDAVLAAAHARRDPRDGQGRVAPAVRKDRRQPRRRGGDSSATRPLRRARRGTTPAGLPASSDTRGVEERGPCATPPAGRSAARGCPL